MWVTVCLWDLVVSMMQELARSKEGEGDVGDEQYVEEICLFLLNAM